MAEESTHTDSTSNSLDNVFKRLPRPQRALVPHRPILPTRTSLLMIKNEGESQGVPSPVKSATGSALSPPLKSPANRKPSLSALHPTSPTDYANPEVLQNLHPIYTLGKFSQDGTEWTVRAQRGRYGLIMVQKLNRGPGTTVESILPYLRHKNITKALHYTWINGQMYLSIEYCRFTLAELIHVHLEFEEYHIKHIAQSIFSAIAYIASLHITHHKVTTKSIRVTTPDLRIVLSDFESATKNEIDQHCDLFDLGIVLLECMDGRLHPVEKRTIEFIRDQRSRNQVFSLQNPEKWSGCKILIDFLDDIFGLERSCISKTSRPHRYVSSFRDEKECMRPYVELATLECFTLWTPGERSNLV
ncbi:unnamed protein product [Periconia digitata]|uniref:Protein kinase domain-containing protein n=1 Tax=Periconia digitata TaxID=1303443 RepID=A0A9W4UMR2_9PLEO|nr:unnamed protein product [Periconia digitata]